jgi:two-component system sensor histidine kinase KdpD
MRLKSYLFKVRTHWPALLVWTLAWIAMLGLDQQFDLSNLSMVLILAACVASLWLSPAISMFISALAIVAFNWTFVPPRGTFSVDLRQHAMLLATALSVSWVVALLMALQRAHALKAERHALQAEQLRALSEALRDADEPADCTELLQSMLAALTQSGVKLLLCFPDAIADEPDAHRFIGELDADEQSGLLLSVARNQALGPGSGRHEDLHAWYLPLRGREASFGAALLSPAMATSEAIMVRTHAQALCDQFGLALERTIAQRQAREAREEVSQQKLRSTLLAAISHDYRTPLATIMGAASSLHDQAARLSPSLQQRLAATIVDEVTQLSRITDNILQFSRLDDGRLQLQLDWESPEEIVGVSVRHARQHHPLLSIRLQVEPALPLLQCDPLLIVQLLDNLLDNAFRYSGDTGPIELVAALRGGQLMLAVRDRGVGIASPWRERLFEAFQPGDPSLRQRSWQKEDQVRRSAGIGLAVCLAIAKAHGGELRMRPRSHGGASFECMLPLAAMPAAAISSHLESLS